MDEKKKHIDEEAKQYYNVYVYQELPYPPSTNTKINFKTDELFHIAE